MISKIITIGVLLLCSLLAAQIGINTATPGSTLDVKGSFATQFKQVISNTYSILKSDQFIDYRGISSSQFFLPAAQSSSSNFAGRIYEIRNSSGYSINVIPAILEKIDISGSANNQTSLTIPAGYYAIIKSTGAVGGSTWISIMSSFGNGQESDTPKFSTSILGYKPAKASQRIVPSIFNAVSASEIGCKRWIENGHTYCAYQLGGGKSFYETFNFAKQIGGYIVTITSALERIWIYNNILSSSTGFNLNNNIWIGYNKVAYPGNPTAFTWITGEDWTIDWTTSPNSTPQSFFASGEPNNSQAIEGSCHIYTTLNNPSRQWNDLNGNTTYFAGASFDQVIIEFNED